MAAHTLWSCKNHTRFFTIFSSLPHRTLCSIAEERESKSFQVANVEFRSGLRSNSREFNYKEKEKNWRGRWIDLTTTKRFTRKAKELAPEAMAARRRTGVKGTTQTSPQACHSQELALCTWETNEDVFVRSTTNDSLSSSQLQLSEFHIRVQMS